MSPRIHVQLRALYSIMGLEPSGPRLLWGRMPLNLLALPNPGHGLIAPRNLPGCITIIFSFKLLATEDYLKGSME